MVSSREARADTVVVIHHASHAVESEAVKVEFLEPVPQVAHEEPEDLVVPIVEKAAVPELVPAARALVEVEVVSTVEQVEAVEHVLARV